MSLALKFRGPNGYFAFFFHPKQCFSLTTIQPEQCFQPVLAKILPAEQGLIVDVLAEHWNLFKSNLTLDLNFLSLIVKGTLV